MGSRVAIVPSNLSRVGPVPYSLLAKLLSKLLSIYLTDAKLGRAPHILYLVDSFVSSFLLLEQRLANSGHPPTLPVATVAVFIANISTTHHVQPPLSLLHSHSAVPCPVQYL